MAEKLENRFKNYSKAPEEARGDLLAVNLDESLVGAPNWCSSGCRALLFSPFSTKLALFQGISTSPVI